MVKHTPTGAKRHRVQTRMFRKPLLVLEVEVRSHGYEMDWNGCSRDLDYTFWRTATVEDISKAGNDN